MVNHAYAKSVGFKVALIMVVIIVFVLLISVERYTTVNINNISLPIDAVDRLRNLLGH